MKKRWILFAHMSHRPYWPVPLAGLVTSGQFPQKGICIFPSVFFPPVGKDSP